MITSDYSRIVGVAWESSEVNQEKRGLRGPYQLVLTAIGLDNNNFVSEMKRVQDEVDNLKEIVNSLVSSLNKLGADIAVPDLQMSSSDVAEEANTTAWAGTIDKMMNATLTNPADATKQAIGVFDSKWVIPIAEVLQKLGTERALIFHSYDGLDEISIADKTYMAELRNNKISELEIDPKQFDLSYENLDALKVLSLIHI